MRGKQVRFASISTAHTASTPSQVYSVPSITSSSDPRPRQPSSSGRPFWQRRSTVESKKFPFKLHILLAYSHHPAINYDIGLPTSTISTSAQRSLPAKVLSEPAVYPPVSHLRIQICHAQYGWPILVRPSLKCPYITVKDIFTSIYHSLHENITSTEYDALSLKDRQKVKMGYKTRYKRLRDWESREAERRKGVKRVDFLYGRTRFMGLAISDPPEVWMLYVS